MPPQIIAKSTNTFNNYTIHCLMAVDESNYSSFTKSFTYYVWKWERIPFDIIQREIDDINTNGLLADKILDYVVKINYNFGLFHGDLNAGPLLNPVSNNFDMIYNNSCSQSAATEYVNTGKNALHYIRQDVS